MQPHLWVRAEQRAGERRVGLMPEGAAALRAAGFRVTVEDSAGRAVPIAPYRQAGCEIAPENSWPGAPEDAIVFGLKELPDDGTPLIHRHIMFGHAFKGQAGGAALLRRFRAGGGRLYDLEYLTDASGRRIAAFGYWAGFAGAAVGLMVWAAQQAGGGPGPQSLAAFAGREALLADLRQRLQAAAAPLPSAMIVGALGRVGSGAGALLDSLGIAPTRWDTAETASGGPFPEILAHELFVNCVLATEGIPVFVPKSALGARRRLSVIADIACDPSSPFNPVPLYDRATSFADPVIRLAADPVLDLTAIDNLPSMLPLESSADFAAQLLPALLQLGRIGTGVWGRAAEVFDRHSAAI